MGTAVKKEHRCFHHPRAAALPCRCNKKLQEDLMAKGNNARKKETKKPKKDKK